MCGGLFGQGVGSVVARDATVAGAPHDRNGEVWVCLEEGTDVVVEAEGEVLGWAGFGVEDGPYCSSVV